MSEKHWHPTEWKRGGRKRTPAAKAHVWGLTGEAAVNGMEKSTFWLGLRWVTHEADVLVGPDPGWPWHVVFCPEPMQQEVRKSVKHVDSEVMIVP